MLTRIAPTPSGFIHTGNIYNFLMNWLWARSNGGKVLLRIDDADAERKRKEYVEDIFRVLDWLGLDWDTGPTGPDDFEKNWAQQSRRDLYEKLLSELLQKNMLFACTCSRKQICHCSSKQIPLDTASAAWKIKVEPNTNVQLKERLAGAVSIEMPDSFVVKKKDGFASYQICSVADDGHFAVTHICRGEDLLPSTAMQMHIDNQLEKPYFNNCVFWHHPLLQNEEGNKLSKSAGTLSSSIIGQVSKEELLAGFAKWAGIEEEISPTLESMKNSNVFKNNQVS
jgi:glutamyl/glutaminyl-tRNA synthetase